MIDVLVGKTIDFAPGTGEIFVDADVGMGANTVIALESMSMLVSSEEELVLS